MVFGVRDGKNYNIERRGMYFVVYIGK